LPDIRELIVLTESAESKQKQVTPQERAEHYSLDGSILQPEPRVVFLFDDVLTTGCHFKAAELVIKSHLPHVTVIGIFLARAVRPEPELLALM
jgi:predicted amidophosphoribosyltransferase